MRCFLRLFGRRTLGPEGTELGMSRAVDVACVDVAMCIVVVTAVASSM